MGIIITDTNLENAIRIKTGLPPDYDITQSELGVLQDLDLPSMGFTNVRSIEGLQYAPFLSSLSLSNNEISDMSPLSLLPIINGGYIDLSNQHINTLGTWNEGNLQLDLNFLKNIDGSIPTISNISPTPKNTTNNIITWDGLNPSSTNIGFTFTGSNSFSGTVALDIGNMPINIPDTNLNTAIKNVLGVSGVITKAQIETLYSLSASNKSISDITGLEYAINLTSLDLSYNNICDITPLTNLISKLTSLNLGNQHITKTGTWDEGNLQLNLSFLKNTDGSIPTISTIYPESNDNTNNIITWRGLYANSTDIGFTFTGSNTFSGTVSLDVGNKIPINIPDPYLNAAIKDALGVTSPVTKEQIETLHSLTSINSSISDITGLEFAINLQSLNLGYNKISDLNPLVSLAPFGNLTNLYLDYNNISDLTPLSSLLSKLTSLVLSNQRITTKGIWSAGKLELNLNFLKNIDGSIPDIYDISPSPEDTGGNIITWERLNASSTDIGFTFLGSNSFSGTVSVDISNIPINIPDTNLNTSIKNILKIKGIITKADIETLYSLNASNSSISDITGLEYAINLTSLDLSYNNIYNLTPLSSLQSKLTTLVVGNQYITTQGIWDEGNLQLNLSFLKDIDGSIPTVSNVSPEPNDTTANIITWKVLYANSTNVGFTFAGTSSFNGLVSLDLGNVPINIPDTNLNTSIKNVLRISGTITKSQLESLSSLSVNNHSVSDITGLEYAVNLQTLNLSYNQIYDISALGSLASAGNLIEVNLSNNNISYISSLSNLNNCNNFTTLHLGYNSITDVSPLSTLTNLNYLYLSRNQISDISELNNLVNLRSLYLWDNHITTIPTLSNLTNLQTLYLSNNRISTITPLTSLSNLRTLSLNDNNIGSISELNNSNFPQLQVLYLNKNQLSDISSLSTLSNLTSLDIGNNHISTISALSSLTNLQKLYIQNNQITNITPLSNLTNLNCINASGNDLSSNLANITTLKNLTNLISLDICNTSLNTNVTLP